MKNLHSRQAWQWTFGAILGLVCLAPVSAAAAGDAASPTVVSGEVVRSRGQWSTKSKPAEWGLPGGGHIAVHDGTDATLLTEPQALALLPEAKIPTYSVILRRGAIDIDVPNANPTRIAVSVGTPTQVRTFTLSGKSTIKVVGRNVIAVCHDGQTTVAQGSKLVRLPTAVKRVYTTKGFKDRPLLEAPPWVGGRRIWISTTGAAIPISGYVWKPVQGATGYLVSLRELAAGRTLAQSRVALPAMGAFQGSFNPGRYQLEVATIDSDGLPSHEVAQIPVSVVGVEAPGGAVPMPKDTLAIGREQKVRLISAEGLTLTTAAHQTGVAGTKPFGLEGLDRASILIHPAGGGDPATLTLVRRQELVSAWVGPKLATWPSDPLDLQVNFVDGRGVPTPTNIAPAVRVMVGVEPVNVTWNKQGDHWHARLAPMSGKGPWVVRLEVVDQHGVVIGRDLAEITGASPHAAPADQGPNRVASVQTDRRVSSK